MEANATNQPYPSCRPSNSYKWNISLSNTFCNSPMNVGMSETKTIVAVILISIWAYTHLVCMCWFFMLSWHWNLKNHVLIMIPPSLWNACFWTNIAKAPISTYLYMYKKLKVATCNFHRDKKLGEGGIQKGYLVRLTKWIIHHNFDTRNLCWSMLVYFRWYHL